MIYPYIACIACVLLLVTAVLVALSTVSLAWEQPSEPNAGTAITP